VTFDRAHDILAEAVGRVTPAAVIDVGRRTGSIWSEAFGRLTLDEDARACTLETIFDLASLTKVIATTSIAMRDIENGRLSLDDRPGRWLLDWREGPQASITVEELLDHSSGLPAHVKLWLEASGRREYQRRIAQLPLDAPPGAAAVYSDIGFMLLGFLLEDIAGRPLDESFAPIAAELGGRIGFRPPAEWRGDIAPTEQRPDGNGWIVGEVHDENAAALDGVAAHAGLFGTSGSVAAFARLVLRTFEERTVLGAPATLRRFARQSLVPNSSRALGWDTMRPTSSCGHLMTTRAIGHTGFTGTSLWIDPEQDLYVVLLTNRVHPTRENNQLAALRPLIHDAVVQALRP
jgi:CubicO group peptidase (beta-lactamase class C family)